MRRNPNIVVRAVDPANFLVDITKCYNSSEETLLEVDEMGLAVWNCIEDGMQRKDIVSAFLSLLIDEKTDEFVTMVTQDVNAFLDLLHQHKCIWEEE